MGRSIILHIGAPKTGSSSIQAFLRKNRDVFIKKGYIIPDRELNMGGLVTGEHVWAFERIFKDSGFNIHKIFHDLFDSASEELGDDQDLSVIVSAENLCNSLRAKSFEHVSNDFNIKVVVYIRRQDELITSAWQQWYSKVESDFHAWLLKAISSMGNWVEILDAWESVVGKNNMVVRIFEKDEFEGGSLLEDFVHCLDLKGEMDDFIFDIERVNPSYSDIITDLVAGNRRIFPNIHDNEFYRIVNMLTGDGYVENRKVSLLTPSQRVNLLKHFEYINEETRKKYFPHKRTLFEPIKHAKYQYLTREEVVERQLKFLTEMIFKLAKRIDFNA